MTGNLVLNIKQFKALGLGLHECLLKHSRNSVCRPSNLRFFSSATICEIRSKRSKTEHSYQRKFCTGNFSRMRFVQFSVQDGPQRLGVQMKQGGDVVDVSGVDASIPNGLVQLLQGGSDVMAKAKRIASEGKSVLPLSSVRLLAPLTAPDKVICVGLNYRGHCEEQNIKLPKEPMFFSKFSSCIVGPHDDVTHPKITTMLDWEVELAVVIGKKAKNVKPEDAFDHVFGYTIGQDISARDWQKNRNGRQWLLGKSMDQFCPLGPAVVVKESLADPHNLAIQCKINGVTKQDSNTGDLIHKIDHIISFFSSVITLLPGDVILTGTPSGVGMFRDPPEFLKAGDVIESEIEGIGKMKNRII